MKCIVKILVLFALPIAALLPSGCAHRIVTGGYEVSPDHSTRLDVVIRPDAGSDYFDIGRKTVNVSVLAVGGRVRAPLFSRQYIFMAAAVEWSIQWLDADHCRVDLYSYPAGKRPNNEDSISNREPATRHGVVPLATLTVARKGNSQEFEEVTFPKKSA